MCNTNDVLQNLFASVVRTMTVNRLIGHSHKKLLFTKIIPCFLYASHVFCVWPVLQTSDVGCY